MILMKYLVSCGIALFGVWFREETVNRDFEEPEKMEKPFRKSRSGFRRSLMLRAVQFAPIGAWILYTLSTRIETIAIAFLLICVLGYLVLLLTNDESRRWDELIAKYSNLD